MGSNCEIQRAIDNEHLRLLSIFYYVLGIINAIFACFPLIYVAMGLFFVMLSPGVPEKEGGAPMAVFGLMFVVMGLMVFLLGATMAVMKIYAGYCLSKRKGRIFCYIAAAISCLSMPYGTILGVFTFIVLSRSEVAAQFEADAPR